PGSGRYPRDVSAPTEASRPYRPVMPTSSDETSPANPGSALVPAVERVLALAATWLAWDGRPRLAADGARAYTPHKAIRRTADHIVDHLAQPEALLAGAPRRGGPVARQRGDARCRPRLVQRGRPGGGPAAAEAPRPH